MQAQAVSREFAPVVGPAIVEAGRVLEPVGNGGPREMTIPRFTSVIRGTELGLRIRATLKTPDKRRGFFSV